MLPALYSLCPLVKHRFKNLRFKEVIVRFKLHRRACSEKAAGQAALPGVRQQAPPPAWALCFLDVNLKLILHQHAKELT